MLGLFFPILPSAWLAEFPGFFGDVWCLVSNAQRCLVSSPKKNIARCWLGKPSYPGASFVFCDFPGKKSGAEIPQGFTVETGPG